MHSTNLECIALAPLGANTLLSSLTAWLVLTREISSGFTAFCGLWEWCSGQWEPSFGCSLVLSPKLPTLIRELSARRSLLEQHLLEKDFPFFFFFSSPLIFSSSLFFKGHNNNRTEFVLETGICPSVTGSCWYVFLGSTEIASVCSSNLKAGCP